MCFLLRFVQWIDGMDVRILDSLRIFPEVYNALCEGRHVIQAARGLPSSLIRLGDELERIVSTLFSEGFAETFKMNVVERPLMYVLSTAVLR